MAGRTAVTVWGSFGSVCTSGLPHTGIFRFMPIPAKDQSLPPPVKEAQVEDIGKDLSLAENLGEPLPVRVDNSQLHGPTV